MLLQAQKFCCPRAITGDQLGASISCKSCVGRSPPPQIALVDPRFLQRGRLQRGKTFVAFAQFLAEIAAVLKFGVELAEQDVVGNQDLLVLHRD
jgi:hypothetical protein